MASSTGTTNRALWLSSFEKPLELIDLEIPTATAGSAVVQPLATTIPPYAKLFHSGKIPGIHLPLPCVPNPTSIARVHSVGPDAVQLKPGDLVFVDGTVTARDNPDVMIMQGHLGGDPRGDILMKGEWRDGSLQKYQKVPLEGCFLLDESRLYDQMKYTALDLAVSPTYTVAAGALLEAAELKPGETVVIGPAGGSFGGAAVEIALAIGASVIALGRSEAKLVELKKGLGNTDRLQYIVASGHTKADAAAIIEMTGGLGVDVYNDWTPGGMPDQPYLAAGIQAVRRGGRVIMSGGSPGNVPLPYAMAVHKNLTVKGKWMCNAKTVSSVIGMVSNGLLAIGSKNGSMLRGFSLEEHEAAVDHAEKEGRWRNYTIITPNTDDN